MFFDNIQNIFFNYKKYIYFKIISLLKKYFEYYQKPYGYCVEQKIEQTGFLIFEKMFKNNDQIIKKKIENDFF